MNFHTALLSYIHPTFTIFLKQNLIKITLVGKMSTNVYGGNTAEILNHFSTNKYGLGETRMDPYYNIPWQPRNLLSNKLFYQKLTGT